MSGFWEEVVQEYPSIARTKTWKKETKYVIRLVYRHVDGLPQKLLDIREYVLSEKRSSLTNKGVYFNKKDLADLITILTQVWKDHYSKGSAPYDSRRGSGEKNFSHTPKKKELL
jgi:hypothetical protein